MSCVPTHHCNIPPTVAGAAADTAVSLADVRVVVLDEADHMLALGFVEDLRTIAQDIADALPRATTWMFSATWPRAVHDLAVALLRYAGAVVAAVRQRW